MNSGKSDGQKYHTINMNKMGDHSEAIHKEKLASLGYMLAGVVHELKSPLNHILNWTELAIDQLADLDEEITALESAEKKLDQDNWSEQKNELQESLEKVRDHGNRLKNLIWTLLDQARKEKDDDSKAEIALHPLIEESLNLAYNGVKGHNLSFTANLIKEYDPEIDKVLLFRQEMLSALINIMLNAFQAMNRQSEENPDYVPELKISTKRAGNRINICIRDNGPGIPEGIRDQIFQPFFTTKNDREGTGLGLALVLEAVHKQGGELRLNSIEGQHTEFNIELQITEVQ